jgi:hypothetical protein
MCEVKLIDDFGKTLGSALKAVGWKFMTEQHVANAKTSALQSLEAKEKGWNPSKPKEVLFPAKRPRTRPDLQVANWQRLCAWILDRCGPRI